MKRICFTQLTFLLLLSSTFAQQDFDSIGLSEGISTNNQIEGQFTEKELTAEQTTPMPIGQHPDWLMENGMLFKLSLDLT